MPNYLWEYDPMTLHLTRATIHGAIEEATQAPLNPNDALADTLIAQAQALGIAPIHLRAWIYHRSADDGWSAEALEKWARGMGLILAEKP
jgi:hypothetical protein